MTALIVGGTTDHVHMLISLPANLSIAEAMKQIKGGSSMWVHKTFPEQRLFSWQEKYGAFTVSVSVLDSVIDYIKNQEEHHRKKSFKEEFIALLRKHGVQYKEQYLWE